MNALSGYATPDYLTSIRAAESGGNDRAKNPRSTAAGRYQFIDSTWRGLMKSRPDLGLTADGRFDPDQQERAIRAFTDQNATALKRAGISVNSGTLYAAHFLGAGGAVKALSANPNARIEDIVGSGVVSANPFLRGKTVADFGAWASRKGGGGDMPTGNALAGDQPYQPTQFEPMVPVSPVAMAEAPQMAQQAQQRQSQQQAQAMPVEPFQQQLNALSAYVPQYDTRRHNTARLMRG